MMKGKERDKMIFETAKWIAAPDTEQPSPLFRRAFEIRPGLDSASLAVCGLGYGVFTINGQSVTEDVLTTPLTKFDATVLYNVYDVTALLTEGENAAGVMLGNGWYHDVSVTWDYEKASWRHHPKFIFRLELSYEDGSRVSICSDAKWKTHPGPCTYNQVRRGECWDARKELIGFDTPGFEENGWTAAFVCRPPGGVLRQTGMPPIRVTETIPAKEIFPGVFDLGQNISGWARIHVSGEAGQSVSLTYSERICPDGSLDTEEINRFCEKDPFANRDVYILKGGEAVWEPHFCYHGFRYVKCEGEATVQLIEGRVVHTDLERVGEFSCGDDMLNRIHKAVGWSTLTNYHSIPTDCPHREQNGWTGDALMSCEQTLMNFEMTEAYRKWLRDFGDVQRPSGQLPGIIPTSSWGFNWGSGPAWDSALILIPYYVWKYTGNLSLAEEFWPNMERYMRYLQSMEEEGTVEFGLGDWCAPENTQICPVRMTDTAYYYADARSMGEMARALGHAPAVWEDTACRVKEAFRRMFVRDGSVEPESQTAYACAIYQGLLEKEECPAAAARLNELVVEKDFHIDCGILGTKYIFRALSDYGYGETIYRMVVNPTYPSYAWWIKNGMTTLCEDWEMKQSLNHHMFSEVELWFYRYLAGIRMDEEERVIAPVFLPQISWVQAKHRDLSVFWNAEYVEVVTEKPAVLVLDGKRISLPVGSSRVERKGI